MPFRNGEVKKGGDPTIWETMNATDYGLLWRSVSGFSASPINEVLDDLYAWQRKFVRLNEV